MADSTSKGSTNQNLINFLLTGPNYYSWARAVTMGLGGRSKLGHITGATKAPTEIGAKYDEWMANDLGVMSLICNTMEPKIYEIFAYSSSAKELWDSVHEMYGNLNNSSRIFEIQQQLVTLNQNPGQPIVEHFGKMKQLWEELRLHRPPATTVNEYRQREEHDQIFRFLASLTSEFEETRRDILMRSELPSLNTVYAILQSEETRKKVMGRDHKVNSSYHNSENSAHFSSSKTGDNTKWSKGKDKKGNRPHCDHCNRSGHIKEKCWVLHPYLKPARSQPPEGYLAAQPENGSMQHKLDQLTKQIEYLMKSCAPSADPTSAATNGEVSNAVKHVGKHCALSTSSYSKIIVDSGATDNMFVSNKLLTKWQSVNPYPHVVVANGLQIPTNGSGRAQIFSKETDVTVVPELKANLLSVSKCTNQWDCNIIFTPQKVVFQDRGSGMTIGEGRLIEGLYVIRPELSALMATRTNVSSATLWHQRLGHPSDRILHLFDLSLIHDTKTCHPCQFAKLHRLPFPEHSNKSNKLFELIHSDVWGNSPIDSKEGFKYFVTFIDDKSRATWLYLLKSKKEVSSVFQKFYNMVENQFNTTVKFLRTDNGTEYLNHDFQNFLCSKGIMHQTSCVGTPQQNGIAERKNRHLLEVTRALLFSANLPKIYWSYAVLTGCYLINRLPSRVLDFQSPFEILYGRKPNISHLRVFGCTCFVHSQNAGKLDSHARKCIFVGYSSTQKGYKCYDPNLNRLFVSRDVRFDETQMFYVAENQREKYDDFQRNEFSWTSGQFFSNEVSDNHTLGRDSENDATEPSVSEPNALDEINNEAIVSDENHQNLEVGPNEMDSRNGPSVNPNEVRAADLHDDEVSIRKSTRIIKPPARLQDFITYHTAHYPIQDYIRYDKISQNFRTFLTRIEQNPEPNNFEEARKHSKWVSAMNEELEALSRNKTWELVTLPVGKKTVGCRWVFKIKYKSDGTVERYKARLVAKGYTQTYGIDYKETFAPVTKMNTVRTVMSIATNCDWPLFQMDVRNAFLHGDLEEEVYMDLPPGMITPSEKRMACRLKKAIYGLKQSPRAWYGKLSSTLGKIGFKRSEADSSMFTKTSNQGIVVILIYVDDLIITGSDKRGIIDLKLHLGREFDIKDLGNLKYFLGIEIARSQKGLFLSQRKYILDLLRESGKMGVKPANIPMDYNQKVISDNIPLEDIGVFQRIVGKLIYLTITRPDIAFVVSYVSQFMQKPMRGHMDLVNQVLRYLKASPGRGIMMKKLGRFDIVGYADADWAGNPFDRKSTTGFCMFVGGNLVIWKSKKQTVVARSSAEAEYRAMAATTSEIIWLRLLIQELGFSTSEKPTQLFCDNQAAIQIASNPVFHERTKHIEVDCHFIREKILNKVIETPYIRSSNQLADIFTKALTKGTFEEIMSKLTSDDPFGSA
jgi:Reverse transcriptase (RNA-dependent DNA polymerase)/Integrase core domain/gag-polypeptide of LTR copia-type/GAG-pre-integrase domain